MCGICGYWTGSTTDEIPKGTAGRMAAEITHRGPDSAGVIIFPNGGPSLAHRRLAIIDVTDAGSQPMVSESGRYTIVYNGETYNHRALRETLEADGAARKWRGHSDTESILACFEAWGVERTVINMTGMFAFALWDDQAKSLTLVRDRMGEKPLYYGVVNGNFLFGSELRALHQHPSFATTIDRSALTAFLQRSYVPGPASIYSEIKKLQPGHMIEVTREGGGTEAFNLSSRPYWQLDDAIASGRQSPFIGAASRAVADVRSLLADVIESQMLSDVPLGTFLSGGIDSSLVAAIMTEVSTRPVKTFSIGFRDKEFDESESAQAVANHLGTDHTQLIVEPEHIIELLPRLPDLYSEPFGDSSQLPTFLVSQLAREHVTVALTGDGADESFGGYNRYLAAGSVRKYSRWLPPPIGTATGNAILSLSKARWEKLFRIASAVLSSGLAVRNPGEKMHKIGRLLKLRSRSEYFESLISMTDDPASFVVGGRAPPPLSETVASKTEINSFEHWMMSLDAQTYLPDDICVKVDTASMANSLETRAPFLDRRVVEFAWTLPLEFKIRDGKSKWILREALSTYLPRELFERPKMGFGIPFGKWMRGPLRAWGEHLLTEERLRHDGFFEAERVREVWDAHQAGIGNHEYLLWNVLMFNSWFDRWGR
ncbi:AsnB Asparagine synthase (glutamine-hydrolyzing) [Caulobacteraceae bacterium]